MAVDVEQAWITVERSLPTDAHRAELIGRVWSPQAGGPVLVRVDGDALHDLSSIAATSSDLLNLDDPLAAIRGGGPYPRVVSLDEVLANSVERRRSSAWP